MLLEPARSFLPTGMLLLFAAAACHTPAASTERAATNASLSFAIQPAEGEQARPVTVCLVVARPNAVRLHNGPDGVGVADGRAVFPAGTRAAAVVAHYATLLKRHGWVDGTHFTAADNSLHFYGITELAAGADDARLGIFAATDSDRVPYRTEAPLAK